jgi:hypothetical protein
VVGLSNWVNPLTACLRTLGLKTRVLRFEEVFGYTLKAEVIEVRNRYWKLEI